jgi:hypothetical protein
LNYGGLDNQEDQMDGTQIPLLNTKEAARLLELDQREVVRRIRRGDIKASKWGWSWAIEQNEIDRVKTTDWYQRFLARYGNQAD